MLESRQLQIARAQTLLDILCEASQCTSLDFCSPYTIHYAFLHEGMRARSEVKEKKNMHEKALEQRASGEIKCNNIKNVKSSTQELPKLSAVVAVRVHNFSERVKQVERVYLDFTASFIASQTKQKQNKYN